MKINGLLTEFLFWILAICLLACVDLDGGRHMSLCPLASLGLSWCPGCGFGRSITALLQGNIQRSLDYHWFGVPGMLVIFHRIFSLWQKIKLSFLSKSVI